MLVSYLRYLTVVVMAPCAIVERIKRTCCRGITQCIRSRYGVTTTDQKVEGPEEKEPKWIYMGVAFESLC